MNTRKNTQSGASLIVVMVIMMSMTMIALATTTDTAMQFQMVRNDQFYTSAYQAAYSEINGQIGVINSNKPSDDDEIILNLLGSKVGVSLHIANSEMAGPHRNQGPFDQKVSFEKACNQNSCPAPVGYSMTGDTKVMRASLDSRAEMSTTRAASDQTQAFWYLLPSPGPGVKTRYVK